MVNERVAFGLVLTVGVVVPGVVNYVLSHTGYGTAGTVVWVGGYLTMVLFVWYRWIRPLDLTGPT